MKFKKSKKAYTLVELVVTIAILSITATMGIGIFASAMSNYSKASFAAKEQEKALEIENFILRYARVATDVYFITNDSSLYSNPNLSDHYASSEAAISLDDAVGGVLTSNAGSNIIGYHTKYKDDSDNIVNEEDIKLSGVKSIEFKLSNQKSQLEQNEDVSFVYLNYKINMIEGYSVDGAVMLYNCKNVIFTHDPGAFVETTSDVGTFAVGDEDFNTGIAFLKK